MRRLLDPFFETPGAAFGKPVCRLGLATRGDGAVSIDDVHRALDRGINFLNWPGCDDALSRAIAALGPDRDDVVVCTQFSARTAREAADELKTILASLGTEYIDALTFYYVEANDEWAELRGPRGALGYLRDAQRGGTVRRIGLTTHQRPLAAEIAQSGLLDLLMLRYNAAHRGAECEVFPVTERLGLPIVAYTALRWGALLKPTPEDPPGFEIPPAPAWYRFVLQSPSVAVVLMAPTDRSELEENLTVLDSAGPLPAAEYARLIAHGDRVHRTAGTFP